MLYLYVYAVLSIRLCSLIYTFMQSYLYVYAVLLYVFNPCNIITTKKNVCIKMANDLVVKNNALIDASYTLSLVEQRLIGLAFGQS